ncbi:hypothetical protein [Sulfurospirillum cavolei]|uniref:hypothetical protein n=1 Tax=Sulfurospirillum cavolei TaxID=366522 RepID=UPI0005AAE7C2|nr:hypothetical protein [Sulfurospirillum cavolei]
MHEILKRLELIKTSIAIEDEEIINLQVIKLSTLSIDAEVERILKKITNNDFANVTSDIEVYLMRFSGITIYEDKEVQGLKLELKVLEKNLQKQLEEKNEYINTINEFNTQYTLHVGGIIQKILHVKQEILSIITAHKESIIQSMKDDYEELKQSILKKRAQKKSLEEALEELNPLEDAYDELYEKLQSLKEELDADEEVLNEKRKEVKEAKQEFDEDPDTQEYEEAKRAYEEFSGEYEEKLKDIPLELSENEKEELKKLYRQASRLCHPDIVADELKVQAHEMMQKLNDAYSKKDLAKIKEILFALENGTGFIIASDSINDKEQLKVKITELREKLKATEDEIAKIQSDEAFEVIKDLDDWEAYFEQLKYNLERELLRVEDEYEALLSGSYVEDESDETEDDNYWSEKF